MAENRIELKSVGELLGMKFFIPSYQRGYRWGELQIKALLEDIFNFDEKIDGDFYCLQPLVVLKSNDKWRVIDGQQRLTTIYLILRSLSILYELKTGLFLLEYERESYIAKCDESNDIVKDNIELYHITKAKSFINSWIDRLEDNEKKNFIQTLLYQTKFIVYNVGFLDLNEERKLFNNLNSGRIALTNAELIKALFLNKVEKIVNDDNKDELQLIAHREVEQRLLADEFDVIERTIRQDDFWSFLAGDEEKPSSCINLLFDLMLDADDNAINEYHKDEKYRTFFYFIKKAKGEASNSSIASKKMWEKVREVFYIMVGWFNDAAIYNLIGYHRAIRSGKSLSCIYKKYKESNNKSDFKKWLIEECKEGINYPDGFMELRYDEDKNKVFNLLLLFNIISLLNKPQEQVKFNFTSFHANKWDVEHISPQNPKGYDVLFDEIMKEKNNKIFDNLRKAIEENNEDIVKEEKRVFIAEGDELMGLQNLTLLTAHDNRGIGNKFFFEKRNSLQENYKKGSFIPLCSMNVFMKFYSKNPNQMLFWDRYDQLDYFNMIRTTIDTFFNENINE